MMTNIARFCISSRVSKDNIRQYKDIESFYQNEDVDILYPSWLPEGAVIDYIDMTIFEDGFLVIYSITDQIVQLSISQMEGSEAICDYFDPDNIDILYYEDELDYYRGQFEYNVCSYSLGAKNEHDLELLTSNLREYERR